VKCVLPSSACRGCWDTSASSRAWSRPWCRSWFSPRWFAPGINPSTRSDLWPPGDLDLLSRPSWPLSRHFCHFQSSSRYLPYPLSVHSFQLPVPSASRWFDDVLRRLLPADGPLPRSSSRQQQRRSEVWRTATGTGTLHIPVNRNIHEALLIHMLYTKYDTIR